MDFRPDIRSITDGAGLRKWYWRKAELVDRARELHLKTTASKIELLDRITTFWIQTQQSNSRRNEKASNQNSTGMSKL